ncbi:MAG TPA: protease inhibitor I42 family protein [Polyangiaceae bacterium]
MSILISKLSLRGIECVSRLSALCVLAVVGCSRPGSETAPAASVATAPVATAVTSSTVPAAEPPASVTSAVASAAPAAANAGAHVYGQTSHQIAAKPGEHFSVLLPASIGTPMKWRIDLAPDAAVLGLLGESYADAPPSDCADCTGYTGTRRFDLDAKAPGNVALDFSYRPLTQAKAPAEKQVHIDVRVSP